MLERKLDLYPVLFAAYINGFRVERHLVVIQFLYKVAYSALIFVFALFRLTLPVVLKYEQHVLIQIRKLPQTLRDRIKVYVKRLENSLIR